MKKFQHIAIGLALLAVLAGGGVGASAKRSSKRAVNGIVRNVDMKARTVEVRDQETGRVVSMRVPAGSLIRTNITNQPLVQMERLLPGMVISVIVQ